MIIYHYEIFTDTYIQYCWLEKMCFGKFTKNEKCTLTEGYLKNLPNKEKIIIVLKLGNEPANKIAVFV